MEVTDLQLVLGLEIHIHLKTQTKMFCSCDAHIYSAEPNTHTCPSCLGLPGALPVANFEAIQKTQLLGLALNCKLNHNSRFDRKHYFYPDLAKGYQISQYKQPLCENGYLTLDSGDKVEIERVHLEEDTAKSFHEGKKTLIDFNKSGMPLVEIVTTPTFKSTEDAVEFCKKIQDIVRTLQISDADMEKGQMRLEANISMRTTDMEKRNELPKYKVEVKNINSFRFMGRAVTAEMQRQSEILTNGETPEQENRGYDEYKNVTVSQRSKEEAHDYRYFPEPDIPPMVFDAKYIEELKSKLPELPWQIKERLVFTYGLSNTVASQLTISDNADLLQKFEKIVDVSKNIDGVKIDLVKVANLLLNKPDYRALTPQEFVTKFNETENKTLDGGVLDETITRVIHANSQVVEGYKSGKVNSIEFLVGQVMRETKGKALAEAVRAMLIEKLS